MKSNENELKILNKKPLKKLGKEKCIKIMKCKIKKEKLEIRKSKKKAQKRKRKKEYNFER